MSLRDGLKKMSKSDPSDYSRIMLSDSEDEIVKKIKKAKTDPLPLPDNLDDAKNRPEAINLLTIYAALSDQEIGTVISEYGGKEFSQFKNDLGELASAKLSPISVEMNKLMKDENYLDSVIIKGKERAINVADPVLNKIYEIIGLFRG